MKSVIQEASTIAKAIEQGWIKAGKPKDFTVKIFEEPKKNFLGFTTKNAKVGIFIEERQRGGDMRPKKHVPSHRRQHHPRKDRQWSSDQRHEGHPQQQDKRHDDHHRKHGHDKHEQQQQHHGKHDDHKHHEHPHDHHHDRDDHKKNN